MGVTVSTRVDEELARRVDEIADAEKMDRATILRRFISDSVLEWCIKNSLKDYEEGKLTLWQAAQRCGLSLWEMVEETKSRDVHVPYTLEDLREDAEGL